MDTITYTQVQDLLQQLPEARLSAAYQMLLELIDRGETLQSQLDFMHLPLTERRRILTQQAEELKAHYEQTAEGRSDCQAGDFLHEGPAR